MALDPKIAWNTPTRNYSWAEKTTHFLRYIIGDVTTPLFGNESVPCVEIYFRIFRVEKNRAEMSFRKILVACTYIIYQYKHTVRWAEHLLS